MRYKYIVRILLATMFILLLPLLVMQFTDEVDWDLTDFAIAGVLMFCAGLAFKFIAMGMITTAMRVVVGIVILIVVLLIWAELAVGIFGTPFAGS